MTEEDLEEEALEPSEIPTPVPVPKSAAETAQKPRKVIGIPITKETAKQYALSAAAAKRKRKEARMKMLNALCTDMDLGKELLKAMKTGDEKYLGMIEKATRLVGLQHDQSPEALAQRFEVKSESNIQKREVVINFRRATPEDAK